MKTNARQTAIGIAIAAALMTACSPTQQMTKPVASSGMDDTSKYLMKTSAKASHAGGSDAIRSFPASPMKVANNNMDCGPNGKHRINNNGAPEDAVKIRVTGYGAPPKSFYPDPQRRLMAMRAAKIDAYRSLAERVTGIQIWGGTTIGDMVVEKDRFRVYIDTYINGARVIAENPLDDGTFETIVELTVDQNFLNNTLPERVINDCVQNVNMPGQSNNKAILHTADASATEAANYYFAK